MKFSATGRFKPHQFAIFEQFPEVHAFISTRHSVNYTSISVNQSTEESTESRFRAEKDLYNAMQIPTDRIARIHQVHGDCIVYARQPGMLGDGDGIVTNKKNLYLRVVTADCLSVFIYDPCVKAIGLVHTGWRGLCREVVAKTFEKMQALFNSNPQNVIIAIGPFIQPCCYTVKEDVAGMFPLRYAESMNNGTYKLDLGSAAVEQLSLLKVPYSNIEIASECTCCRDDLFYSARRDNIKTGRNVSIMWLQ